MTATRKIVRIARRIRAFDVKAEVLSILPCFHDLAECTCRDVGMSVHGSDPVMLVVRDRKACVDHSERREESLVQEILKRFFGDDLNQMAEHIDGHAVIPFRSRLVHQWKARQLCDYGFQRSSGITHHFRLPIHFPNCGRNFASGSDNWNRPSSYSVINAVHTTGFVIE